MESDRKNTFSIFRGTHGVTLMKLIRKFGVAAAALACWSMVAPQLVYATSPASSSVGESIVTARDVALGAGGTLRGQVVDGQGVAQAAARVAVVKDNQLVTLANTDKAGEFTVSNLSGGVYQIATEKGAGVYRLWAPRTAPPAASDSALVVANGEVVRGNFDGSWLGFLANPWVLAGLVAAAIAIPLALDDDDAS